MAKKRRVSALVLGGMMILGGISGLFWNEWRSAHRIATLLEGQDQAVSAVNGKIAQNHDGKLIHITAAPLRDGLAIDPVFTLARETIKLARRVEMYQWQERKQGSDGDRETVYERKWSERRIESDRFESPVGHANPPFPNISSESFYPAGVQLGDYSVSPDILSRIEKLQDVTQPPLPAAAVAELTFSVDGNYLTTAQEATSQIGDVRVSWRQAPEAAYSVLAEQDGTRLEPWQASNGGEIGMIEVGELTMPEMFDAAFGDNSRVTWLARGGFTVAIFIGFTIVIRRLARMIPLLGAVAAKLSKPLAFILTAVTALLTIAAGWLVFRPFFSLALAAVAVLGVMAIRWMRAKSGDDDLAHADQPPPPPSMSPPPSPAG